MHFPRTRNPPRNAINLLNNFCHLLNWKLPAAGHGNWLWLWLGVSWEIPLDISRILFVLGLPAARSFAHFVDWSPSGLEFSVQLLLIFNCVDFSCTHTRTQSSWNEIIYNQDQPKSSSRFGQLSRAHFACNGQIKYNPTCLFSSFVSALPICSRVNDLGWFLVLILRSPSLVHSAGKLGRC